MAAGAATGGQRNHVAHAHVCASHSRADATSTIVLISSAPAVFDDTDGGATRPQLHPELEWDPTFKATRSELRWEDIVAPR